MPNRWIIRSKVLVHLACLAQFLHLVWLGYQSSTTNPSALGPDPTATVTFATGFATLYLLLISLAISPVRKLIPQLSWLIRYRRMLGLYAFFYASLHLLTYLWLYADWNLTAMVDDVTRRPYIWAGLTAWTLMLPLALTSTTWSIRKLGGKRWNWLHRLVYLSAIAGVLHYWWIVKTGVYAPLELTLVLAVLLALRPILSRWKRKPVRATPTAPTLTKV